MTTNLDNSMKLSGDHNQCPTCSEYFNSTYAFDKHRVGEYQENSRRCLKVDEMMAKGMAKSSKGFWVTSPMPAKAIPSE